MRYYVLAANGERYGPADIATLNEWAVTGRLFGSSKLIEEMSGNVVVASSVQGLVFGPVAAAGPMQPPPPAVPIQPLTPGQSMQPMQPMAPMAPSAGQVRPGQAFSGGTTDDGKKDLLMAFGIAVGAPFLALIFRWGIVLAIAGGQLSWNAMKKGHKLGILALVLNIVSVIAAIYLVYFMRYSLLRGY